MTVPLTVQNPSKAAAEPATAAVRKRRRRAPAGGAADDCFTCSKRNVKCDRRRPYCSQCLEVGNECSGYKTQLTWGVGVASRGKLRGLSLPIAKAPPVTSSGSGSPVGITKKPMTSSPVRQRAESAAAAALAASWSEQEAMVAAVTAAAMSGSIAAPSLSPRHRRDDIDLAFERSPSVHSVHPASYSGYDLPQMSPGRSVATPGPMPVSVSVPVQHNSWSSGGPVSLSPYSTSIPTESIPVNTPTQHHQHMSASLDSLSDVDYMSPLSHNFPREEISFAPSPTAMMYDGFTAHNSPVPQSPVAAMMIEQRLAPTSCPSLVYAPSEQSSSLPSSHPENYESKNFDANLSAKLLQECENMGTPPDIDAYSTSAHSTSHLWGPFADGDGSPQLRSEAVAAAWPTMMDSQAPTSADLLIKMPFFLDYYENTMCPSMVFIDGPNNPFREHIMQLARTSRSLQHAICALAACNLRMKRKLSLGQHRRDISETADDSNAPEDQSVLEEYQHRNLAVRLLNEQLNDPVKSRHDSILATILLLCHYRMAESGIARFHTHFAGVRKILTLRRASPFPPSRDCAWMEALFTYFDAISASINDREAQLNTSFFGVMPDAQLLPQGAENLVGCDRELFKTIIKLGRLNLLSQNRQVQNLLNLGSNGNTSSSATSGNNGTNSASPMGRAVPSRSQSPFGSSPSPSGGLSSTAALDDHRSTFWREWKEARIALQSWEFDSQRLIASLQCPVPPTSSQVRDIGSLSEAFRYAALLYTERLASPNVPSTHSNFRNLVSQVVYYATSLEAGSSAEKFLLWPLFVAGSECVNELQQNMVRAKCREIMSRSGYMNNLAALDVLERLWAGEAEDEKPNGRGPFNWTRCIGGEVEWIMF